MIARAAALVLLVSCLPLPRHEGPDAPPAPIVKCDGCTGLIAMRENEVIPVSTRWASTCAKLYPMPLSDTHDESDRNWSRHEHACQRKPFRATVTCSRACDVRAFRAAPVSGEDASFNVVPRGSGAIRITVDLRRDDTGETHHWTSDEMFTFGPADVTLLCFDRRTEGYEPCATHALDPVRPLFALAVRRDDRWIPLRASRLGRRSVEDVEREMYRNGEPGGLEGELQPISLAILLGVDPLPPGEHTIPIELMSMYFDRTLRVAPR
jgi:hypothetical protein